MSEPTKYIPAQGFHVWEYISDEMEARGWDQWELARRMGGDLNVNYLTLELCQLEDKRLVLGEEAAKQLAHAFGTSHQIWLNLDESWRAWANNRN